MDSRSRSDTDSRLNPFAFPSNVDFNFALLIGLVLCASILMFRLLTGVDVWDRHADQIDLCMVLLDRADSAPDLESFLQARGDYQQCMAPLYADDARAVIAGLAAMLVLALVIFLLQPRWKIWREKLVPLPQEDFRELIPYLGELSQEAGLDHPPLFLLDPVSESASGTAFGAGRQTYVKINAGLIKLYLQKEVTQFRAILLHELAHIRNGDVNKTYFSYAIWTAFVLVALVPLAFAELVKPPSVMLDRLGMSLNLGARVVVLAFLVYLTRNAVLRAREHYADVRASTWGIPLESITQALDQTVQKEGTSGWRRLLRVHPSLESRRQVMQNTDSLFHLDLFECLVAGLAAGVALSSLQILIGFVLTGTQSIDKAPILAAAAFAPFIVGVVGIGLWRLRFLDLVRGRTPVFSRIVVALGLGLFLGELLSMDRSLEIGLGAFSLANALWAGIFHLLWLGVLLPLLYLFVHWISTTASAWLESILTRQSPRLGYTVSWIAASLLLALVLGTLFRVIQNDDDPSQTFLAVFAELSSLFVTVPYSSITLLALIAIWGVPLAVYFSANTVHFPPSWAYLSGTPTDDARPSSAAGLQIRPTAEYAVRIGMIASVCVFAVRILLRLGVSSTTRADDTYKQFIYMASLLVALLVQCALAVVVVRRVRYLAIYHGLFAAFLAGAVMSIVFLLSNVLLGGGLDLAWCRQVFYDVCNRGGLLALPVALATYALLRRRKGEPAPLA